MAYKIAVASTDGKVVNQHFGKAERFFILEVNEKQEYALAEIREMSAVCDGGTHNDEKLKENAQKLQDCAYVLVSRIGPGAENTLKKFGIEAYVIPDLIEEAVKKVMAHVEIQAMIQSFSERNFLTVPTQDIEEVSR